VSPRFSRWSGGRVIGADFFDRRGALARGPAPRGVVERIADLAHPGIDVARVHPAVARFFEDTAALELWVESRWRFPLSWLWPLGRRLMRAIGQFVLPLREGRIVTQVLAIDRALDGRGDARAVIRAYADSGEVMQAVAYATWEAEGTRYMSASFPMPGGQVAGLLRLDALEADDEGWLAVELTSRRKRDRAGLWLVVGPLALPAPFGERLRLWPAGAAAAPPELDPTRFARATIVGLHEQRLLGFRFVTHRYWFRPFAG
jgi:hypothetical protein